MLSGLFSLAEFGLARVHLHLLTNGQLGIPNPTGNKVPFFGKGFHTNTLFFRAPASKVFCCTPFPMPFLRNFHLQSWTKISRQNPDKKKKTSLTLVSKFAYSDRTQGHYYAS